jgi:phosphate transport system substrate-binding protein
VLVVMSCACTGEPQAAPPARTTEIVGAGATFPYPVYRAWIADYLARTGQRINYLSVGSAEGMRIMERGEADFGATDRLPRWPARGARCAPIAIPMLSGPIAVVYNLPGARDRAPLVLDAADLAGIFAGRIRRWDAPAIARRNATVPLPNIPIRVVHRGVGSGTSLAFQSFLATSGAAGWTTDGGEAPWPVGIAAEGNDGVVMEVSVTEGAVGYAELAYARMARLPVAAIVTAGRAPSLPGAGRGDYPLIARSYMVVDPEVLPPERRAPVATFLRWALHEGSPRVRALEYEPPPADTVARYDSLLADFTRSTCPMRARAIPSK